MDKLLGIVKNRKHLLQERSGWTFQNGRLTPRAMALARKRDPSIRTTEQAVARYMAALDQLRDELRDAQLDYARAVIEQRGGVLAVWEQLPAPVRDALTLRLVLGCRGCGRFIAEFADEGWMCGLCDGGGVDAESRHKQGA